MADGDAVAMAPTPAVEAVVKKPAVLIIGGLGYIGRFLALYIHKHDLASEVRIVDKHLPELAMLAPEFKEACSRDNFIQADASREQNFPRIFDRPGTSAPYDYIFNCGGETKYGQDDEVYRIRSYSLSLALGTEAARRQIPCFIELSTGQVYKPDSKPRTETDKLKPSPKMAKWKLKAEEDLAKIEGLNLVVLRLPHVYGDYTSRFLGTILCMARVYQELGKDMKWLWKEDLRGHTVHVDDTVRAMWHAAKWATGQPYKKGGHTFNIVDHGDTTQGSMAKLINNYFNIPTGFHGTIISTFARLNLESVIDDVNEETMDPWSDLQYAHTEKLLALQEQERQRREREEQDLREQSSAGAEQPPPVAPADTTTAPVESANGTDTAAPVDAGVSADGAAPIDPTSSAPGTTTNAEILNPTPSTNDITNTTNTHPALPNDTTNPTPASPPITNGNHTSASLPSHVTNSPLTPFMEKELLRDQDLCLDGRRFEQETGFAYTVPRLDDEQIRKVVESYRRMGWWPERD